MSVLSEKPLSVSELTFFIKNKLEQSFAQINLEGEISNFRPAASGHYYFTLKDAEAVISAVMFRGRLGLLKFIPSDGKKVIVSGRLSVYAKRGNYQIICEDMRPAGAGDILLLLEERKRRLAQEGLFDSEHKKLLPDLPKKVGVITSPTGAAIRDILKVTKTRSPGMDIVVLPALVQGEEAAAEIVEQIDIANRYELADILIIGRGGGSLEDLLPFSDERVVRSVFRSEIPVISAVGHEVDSCLSDLVADAYAPTPSAAAEMVSLDYRQASFRLLSLKNTLCLAINSQIEKIKILLEQFHPQSLKNNLELLLQPAWQTLDGARTELQQKMAQKLIYNRHRLELTTSNLLAVSPKKTLKRGFAIVRGSEDQKIITSFEDASPGWLVDVELSKGRLITKVVENRQ